MMYICVLAATMKKAMYQKMVDACDDMRTSEREHGKEWKNETCVI